MNYAKGLPAGWSEVPLEQLCDLNPKHDRSIPDDREVSFVPMAAVSEVSGRIETPEVRRFGEVKKGFTHFADGDVIWAKITPCMENGKSAVANGLTSGLGCGSTEFVVLRTQGAVEPSFLHSFMRQESYRRAARATMQSGVGQARVPKEFIEGSVLPVPPLAEQQRLVEKLTVLQSRSAAAKEALDAIPPLLEKFRQSVLAAAFRGDLTKQWRAKHPNVEPASKLLARIRSERRRRWEAANPKKKYEEPEAVDTEGLPELPEGWCWASMEDLAPAEFPVVYGIILPGPHVEDGVPFVRPADIENGTIQLAKLPRTSPEIAKKYHRAALKPGDLVFSIVGTIGKWLIVPDWLNGGNITQSSVRIRALPPFDAEFILRALQTPVLKAQMARLLFGNAVQRLNVEHVRLLALPIPPYEEWLQIAAAVRHGLEAVEVLQQHSFKMKKGLSSLNQSILSKAFRGELVPQDPNDEPASVLLERIRRERSEGETGKRAASGGKKATVAGKTAGQRRRPPR